MSELKTAKDDYNSWIQLIRQYDRKVVYLWSFIDSLTTSITFNNYLYSTIENVLNMKEMKDMVGLVN